MGHDGVTEEFLGGEAGIDGDIVVACRVNGLNVLIGWQNLAKNPTASGRIVHDTIMKKVRIFDGIVINDVQDAFKCYTGDGSET